MSSICRNYQEIQTLIEEKKLLVENEELKVQPSSFEPSLTKKGYIIDAEYGLVRPRAGQTVKEYLSSLSPRERIECDLTNGFELKAGFSYLLPLDTKVTLGHAEYIKSSPKSSMGRIFLNVRLISDFHPNFDEVHAHFCEGKECQLWLLVQPLVFNIIVYPGCSLNQLRFFKGYGARLSSTELYDLCKEKPIIYNAQEPAEHIVTEDGLWLHLKIPYQGVGALRARKNPRPIDISKKDEYDPLEYFEPVQSEQGVVPIRSGEHYLLPSKEILKIPETLNAELRSHSHIGLQGPLHFAGFIDNNFSGDLVLEVKSEEITDMMLEDGMPIGVLDFYKTNKPDILYGKNIGSHYQGQSGLRISKFFSPL